MIKITLFIVDELRSGPVHKLDLPSVTDICSGSVTMQENIYSACKSSQDSHPDGETQEAYSKGGPARVACDGAIGHGEPVFLWLSPCSLNAKERCD